MTEEEQVKLLAENIYLKEEINSLMVYGHWAPDRRGWVISWEKYGILSKAITDEKSDHYISITNYYHRLILMAYEVQDKINAISNSASNLQKAIGELENTLKGE